MRIAEDHDRGPDGKPARDVENIRDAVRPLRRLYGTTFARSFGPIVFRAVRELMIEAIHRRGGS